MKQAVCGTCGCRSHRDGATGGLEGPVAWFIDGRNYEGVCVLSFGENCVYAEELGLLVAQAL